MINVADIQQLNKLSGSTIVTRYPVEIKQPMLVDFLTLSGDKNTLHQSDAVSKIVVPGNMLLCLLPGILQANIQLPTRYQLYTVGYERVRFRSNVHIEDELSASIEISSTRIQKNGIYLTYQFSFFTGESVRPSVEGNFSDYYIRQT